MAGGCPGEVRLNLIGGQCGGCVKGAFGGAGHGWWGKVRWGLAFECSGGGFGCGVGQMGVPVWMLAGMVIEHVVEMVCALEASGSSPGWDGTWVHCCWSPMGCGVGVLWWERCSG